jgi:GNAT superfamily N-acetyltransferase
VDVHVIDPRDEPAFADWYAVIAATQQDLWPGEPGWQLGELRAQALVEDTAERTECLAATDDSGALVGSLLVRSPLLDNTHLVTAELYVHPAHRRRGAGRALLAALEKRATDAGRTVVLVEQEEPNRLGTPSPDRAFALVHGYACAQVDLRSNLALPVESVRLTALEAAWAPKARDYDLVTWTDRCPDEYVEDRALLGRSISTDIPMGDLAMEAEVWDADRVRRKEALATAQGRRGISAGAVHRDTGRLVAYTTMQVPGTAPERAYQWDTIVLPEHRGHRLGTLVKVANLRQLDRVSPATTKVTTWNADDNEPMIAVNRALGFAVVGSDLEWQKHL